MLHRGGGGGVVVWYGRCGMAEVARRGGVGVVVCYGGCSCGMGGVGEA